MSRNSAGTYTLPAGNPVVADTVIDPAWANTTLQDIAEALTNSLDRQGRGGMQAEFPVVDGTLAEPGLNFANDPDNGLHRVGPDEWALVAGGIAVATLTSTQIEILKVVLEELVVDNLTLDGNSITATDTNGNVNVNPDGTGMVKTTDATDGHDTTAGRMLKVGDFGWGDTNFTKITTGSFNDIVTPGLYYLSSDVTEFPVSGEDWWLQVLGDSDDNFGVTCQVAYLALGSGHFFRMKYLGIWGDWYRSVIPEELGTAAAEDVTTSATDTTAGRVLKVGDGGLLGVAPAFSGDFNNLAAGSECKFVDLSAPANKPSAFSSFRPCLVVSDNSPTGWVMQAYTDVVAVHTSDGDTVKLYSDKTILGTVSQSAGVPTGAVIERGSNANGEYVKFADGTMICTKEISLTSVAITNALGGIYQSGNQSWVLPASFVDRPSASFHPRTGFDRCWVSLGSIGWPAGEVSFAICRGASNTYSGTVMAAATGRWF